MTGLGVLLSSDGTYQLLVDSREHSLEILRELSAQIARGMLERGEDARRAHDRMVAEIQSGIEDAVLRKALTDPPSSGVLLTRRSA